MLKRLSFPELEYESSIFFLGPRKTGKSTYLKSRYPNSTKFNFLNSDIKIRYETKPQLLVDEIRAMKETGELIEPVILDEVQKVPELLNSVHQLIEDDGVRFILCGSSARKLHKQGVNLLGGRAITMKCFPFSYYELKINNTKFNLIKAMQRGLIPQHYLKEREGKELLKHYIINYLEQEIKQEALIRNTPSFYRFLDSLGFSNGELVNYSNIARDCGVSLYTVKEYYQIIIDTLLGTYIHPFKGNSKRQTISATPKFYLFDIGIANHLSNTFIESLDNSKAGKSFEHLIYLELLNYSQYKEKDVKINFWRTSHGYEVDFVISEYQKIKVAIECKLTKEVRSRDLKGITLFSEENEAEKLIIISQDKNKRLVKTKSGQKVMIMPWEDFLNDLWNQNIF